MALGCPQCHALRVSLRDRLRWADDRWLGRLRQPGESAESFLRRIADGRPVPGFDVAEEVPSALREFFIQLDQERKAR